MNKDSNCIFCGIVAGEAPASVIYQDEQVMALMTLHPTRPGEFMVIPKEHIDEFSEQGSRQSSRQRSGNQSRC